MVHVVIVVLAKSHLMVSFMHQAPDDYKNKANAKRCFAHYPQAACWIWNVH